MSETIALSTPAALALIGVGLLSSGAATTMIRLSAGRALSVPVRLLPVALYFLPVPTIHKARRALLDAASIAVALVAYAWLGWAAIPLTFAFAATAGACHTDIRTMRLPHQLTRINAASAVVFAFMASSNITHAFVAVGFGLAFAAFFLALGLITNGGLGMGDVYLAVGAGIIAATFGGWTGVFVALWAICLGGIVLVVAFRVKKKGVRLPLGPAIGAAEFVTPIVALSVTVPGFVLSAHAAQPVLEALVRS